MYIFLILLTKFSIILLINCNCFTFQNYYLLGNLTIKNNSEIDCKDEKEDCVYISLNIPDFAIGNFHSCSSDISNILTKIFNRRLDILELFYKAKDNKTNLFQANYFCKNFNNIIWKGDSLSGEVKLYTYCHSQNVIFNETNIVKYVPPNSSAVPVLCYSNYDNEKIYNCSEGYCSMFQISYITDPGEYQQKISKLTCPFEMYNFLKDLSDDNLLYSTIKKNFYNIGKYCSSMDQFSMLVINGTLSYYYYIKCFNPLIYDNYITPEIPIINASKINSINHCKGNTKIANNNTNQNPLLLYIIFLKILKDYITN